MTNGAKTNLTKNVSKCQSDIVDTYVIWGGWNNEYRYVLYREWSLNLPHMVIIGLNPSSADENYDDRTVRRCINFARREGCGSLTMLNIFALRATNPSELTTHNCPIGDFNDYYIMKNCENTSKIICAWGVHGEILDRGNKVLELLKNKRLFCFGMNKDGSPKHPLYLASNTKLVEIGE